MKALLTIFSVAAMLFCNSSMGAVMSKVIEYRSGGITMKGYLAYDNSIEGKRPGIIVVHEWWGLNDYARKRTDMLAELGYTAFAIDMYGQGKTTTSAEQAAKLSTAVKKDMQTATQRFNAGLEVLKKHETVDTEKIAAIGYCFGGGIVLQMALNGADLDGVVTFHGSLGETYPQDKPKVKAAILICHGADDPFAAQKQVEDIQQELRKADADWQMNIYSKAMHSFTNPAADHDDLEGTAYNKEADDRSWTDMRLFFNEIFYGIYKVDVKKS